MTNVLGSMVGGLGTDALYGPDHLGDARPHVLTEMYASGSTGPRGPASWRLTPASMSGASASPRIRPA